MRLISGLVGVRVWLVWGLASLSIGCAGDAALPTAKVSGKVTFKGEALKFGTVSFQPVEGAGGSAEIKPDGTYSTTTGQGANQVQVISAEPEPEGAGAAPGQRKAPPKSNVPGVYGGPTSPLRADIKAGENKHDIDLQDIK